MATTLGTGARRPQPPKPPLPETKGRARGWSPGTPPSGAGPRVRAGTAAQTGAEPAEKGGRPGVPAGGVRERERATWTSGRRWRGPAPIRSRAGVPEPLCWRPPAGWRCASSRSASRSPCSSLAVLSIAFILLGVGLFTTPAVTARGAHARQPAPAARRRPGPDAASPSPTGHCPPACAPASPGQVERCTLMLKDPATWRDLRWLLADMTARASSPRSSRPR